MAKNKFNYFGAVMLLKARGHEVDETERIIVYKNSLGGLRALGAIDFLNKKHGYLIKKG